MMNYSDEKEYLFLEGYKTSCGVCSDNRCPCPQVPIPRNTGYFYIEKRPRGFSANLTCEQGARLRNLDLKSAHEDAKMWWKNGMIPARESILNDDPNQIAPFQNHQTGDALKTIDRIRWESYNSTAKLERDISGIPTEKSKPVEGKEPEFVRNKNGYFFDSTVKLKITYPEVYIPEGIITILRSTPVSQLVKPSKPLYKPPVNRSLYIFWVVIFIIAIGMIVEGENISGNLLGLGGLFMIGTLSYSWNFRRIKTNAEDEYEKDLKYYKQTLERFYEKQKYEFEEQHIKDWRSQQTKKYFRSSSPFYSSSEKTSKGKAENYFYKHLIEFFGKDNIIVDVEVGDFDRPYIPDFVYFDKNSGVKIDIEIDEPYSLSSKEPIHYISLDEKRNQFFNSNKWLVIRFSEEQVITYPERCCKYIHNELKNLNLHNPSIDQSFKYTQDLPPYKKWNKDEARILCDKNFREQVLSDRYFKSFERKN